MAYENEYKTDEICEVCGKGHVYNVYQVAVACEFSSVIAKEPLLQDENGDKKYCSYMLMSG